MLFPRRFVCFAAPALLLAFSSSPLTALDLNDLPAWAGPEDRVPELGGKMEVEGRWVDRETQVLSGVTITRFGRVIRAEEVRWNGQVVFMNRVRVRHADGPDGHILAEEVVLFGKGSWIAFFEAAGAVPDYKSVAEEAGLDQVGYESPECPELAGWAFGMEARDIWLVGDSDALPTMFESAERIHVDRLSWRGQVTVGPETCSWRTLAEIADMRVITVTGAWLQAVRLDMERFAHEPLAAYEVPVDSVDDVPPPVTGFGLAGHDLALHDNEGRVSARADRVGVEWEGDVPFAACWLWIGPGTDEEPGLLGRVQDSGIADGRFSGRVDVSGIEIDAQRFFPPYMPHVGPDRIQGEISLLGNYLDRNADASLDVDLSGFVSFGLTGEIGIGTHDSVTSRLPELFGGMDLPTQVLGFTLHGFGFRFRDESAGKMLQALTGHDFASYVRHRLKLVLLRLDKKIPDVFAAQLQAAGEVLAKAVEQGGTVQAMPPEPVTVMNVMLQSVLRPSDVPELLGLDIRLEGEGGSVAVR